ncbi:MAG TPA: extracellular solute-binding protein [Chloroflexota bacterium]|jgi:multiple sugar transport system substrate-binding protein|nr:extracellular solute-binding protein [Chloroflexota bacterium]
MVAQGGTSSFARRITRRRWGTGAAALTAAAGLAACGTPSAAPAARSGGPVTVMFMQNDSNTPQRPEGATRVALVEEFSKTNSLQITVDTSEAQGSSDNNKIKTLAAAGTPPDLYYTAYYFPAEFYLAGMTVDFDAELKGDKDWGRQRADIFPPMLESSLWAGKLIGLPGYTNNQAIIYNIGLLQQAGIALPRQGWTWDDLKTTAQKFVRPDMVPLSVGWGTTWQHFLGTTGSRPISRDARKITFDTPEMLQVMELYLDLLKRGIALKTPNGVGLNETYQVAKNDTVFEVQGPYRIPVIRQKGGPDFGTVHVPLHPGKREIFASNGGHNLIVFKDVPPARRQAAAQVAKWLNGPHAQAQMCIQATSIPVSKAALDSKELQDYLKTDAAFKGFVDLAPNGWRWPTLPSWGKVFGALDNAVATILREEVGAKAGLATAQQEAQTLLDEDVKLMG